MWEIWASSCLLNALDRALVRGAILASRYEGDIFARREYLGEASWGELGEIDVTPKGGEGECDLAPSTANTSDRYQCQIRNTFGGICEEGQK